MATVVFDLDGTLADTSADLIAAANAVFRARGLGDLLDPARDQATAFRGGKAMLRLGYGRAGAGWGESDVEAGDRPLLDAYRDAIDVHTRLYPGAAEAVERLRGAGYRTAVCTNKPVALAQQLVGELGWQNRFRAVLGADSRPYRKPDPRHLTETLAEAGGNRAIFVGDSRTDADTAIAARVPLVLVSFGYSTEPVELLGADHVIGHFAELLPAIGEIQRQFSAPQAAGEA